MHVPRVFCARPPAAYKRRARDLACVHAMDPTTATEPVEMEADYFPNVSAACVPENYLELPEPAVEIKEPAFYHFKVLYDQSWNYSAIAEKLFMKEHPYLAVIEHLGMPNTHVHFQGMSMCKEESFRNKLKILASQHHLRKIKPAARPTSMVHRPADATGFQYMAKEVNVSYVLAVNKFTMKDLEELKAKSVLHCQALKVSVRDFVAGIPRDKFNELIGKGAGEPDRTVKYISLYLFEAEDKKEIQLPEYNKHHTRNSIVRGILANPACPRKLKAILYSV